MKTKFLSALMLAFTALLSLSASALALEARLEADTVKAGKPITVTGTIEPGKDIYIVVCTDKMFRPSDAPGAQERKKLTKKFADTAIPATYYVITNR